MAQKSCWLWIEINCKPLFKFNQVLVGFEVISLTILGHFSGFEYGLNLSAKKCIIQILGQTDI